MAKPTKAADFLAKMNLGAAEGIEPMAVEAEMPAASARRTSAGEPAKTATGSRQGLKHIGAYLDRETVEKVALLRARLELDNSQLIRHAIERLYAVESARRKFGDS